MKRNVILIQLLFCGLLFCLSLIFHAPLCWEFSPEPIFYPQSDLKMLIELVLLVGLSWGMPSYLKINQKLHTAFWSAISLFMHTFRTDQIFGICLRLLAKLHRPPNSIQSVIFFYRYPDLHSYFVFNLPAVDKTTHQKKPLILALHTSHLARHHYTGLVLGINRIFNQTRFPSV